MGLRLALIGLLVCGCSQLPAPEPPSDDQDGCEAACKRLEELGCEEAEPDANGNSCVVICRETLNAGILTLDTEGVAKANRCPD